MKINDKIYDILKWVAMIALPALSVCVTSIMSAVGVDPSAVSATGTIITALAVFLGTLIGVSTISYYKKDNSSSSDSEIDG